MDESKKKNEKFDSVAFALVQALSPDKRLNRDQIPYAQLRTLVSEFVGKQLTHHYNGRSGGAEQRSSKRGERLGSDEPTTSAGRRSSLSTNCLVESDDNSNSRMSFEDNFSVRTQTLVRVASEKALASMSSSSSSNVVFGGSKPNVSRVRREIRKIQEVRARRREARKCSDIVEFKCEEPELPVPINKLYSRLLAEKRCSYHCFQVLTNSINNFYRPRTWTDNVELAAMILTENSVDSERKKKKGSCRSLSFSKDEEGGKKSRLSVPETPDFKLNRKRQRDQCLNRDSNDNTDGEVVVQTPLAKMRRLAKVKMGARQSPRQHASTREISKRKVSLLLNDIETKQARAADSANKSPVRQAKSPPKPMNKDDFLQNLLSSGSSEKKRPKDGSTEKTPVRFAVAERPKARVKDGKRNLLKRHFSDPNGSLAPDKTWSSSLSLDCDSSGNTVPIIKLSREGRASYSTQVSTKTAKVEDDDYSIVGAAVERYRKRIDKIRAAKYRGTQQENEVFYGRGTSRMNLFEEAQAFAAANKSAGTNMVTRSNGTSDVQSQPQRARKTAKNRQGRSVANQSGGCWYMAHALLNVKNDRPLSPVIPKAMALKFKSPFKLQRLLRRPSRARRRALAKQRAADVSDVCSMKTESSSSRSDSSLRLSVSVDTRKLDSLVADVSAADRKRIERTLLLSPRTNGRLKSAENVEWPTAGTRSRPRSFSISEFPSCPSPPRRSARLLSSTLPSAEESYQTAASFSSEVSSSSGHFADTENTLSADDVFRIMQEKMEGRNLKENGLVDNGERDLSPIFEEPSLRSRPIAS
uniref:Uncharacterized protein n=1 Tax=Plectus sambesii TaxID=2011161 RepID=A0A914UIV3_9BILA